MVLVLIFADLISFFLFGSCAVGSCIFRILVPFFVISLTFSYHFHVTRVKKGSTAYSGPLYKPGKKPKIVVHAAGDVGISGDGYRWRKYGQKMVKGNPHPRCMPI